MGGAFKDALTSESQEQNRKCFNVKNDQIHSDVQQGDFSAELFKLVNDVRKRVHLSEVVN